MGRAFGIMVEKNNEIADVNDPKRKMKYRVVFQGNNVQTANWETALFQGLGSAPASMEAGKVIDAIGCLPGYDVQQTHAEMRLHPIRIHRNRNMGSNTRGSMAGQLVDHCRRRQNRQVRQTSCSDAKGFVWSPRCRYHVGKTLPRQST